MKIAKLLARADESAFQELIGPETLRVLHLLDPSLTTAGKLRYLVELRHPPISLLKNPEKRRILFDALSPSDAESLCAHIGIQARPNPYSALQQLKVRPKSNQERALLSFFDLEVPAEASSSSGPEGVDCTEVRPEYALFEHQRMVVRRTVNALESPPKRALIHMPTGAGKTRTSMHVIAQYLRESESGVVVWLAHSEELCNQAANEVERAWQTLGDRAISIYRYWGAARCDIWRITDGIIVASVPKMHRLAGNDLGAIGALGARTILVVLDEGHKATAPTYKNLVETLIGVDESAGLLGLTATPGRTWDDISSDYELAELFNYNRIPLEIAGYSNPVEYLTSQGYLARPTFRSLYGSGSSEITEEDRRMLETTLEIPDRVLRKLAEDEQRSLVIVQAIEQLIRRHTRILVFSTTVSHAHLIAAVLYARGIEAYGVTGETTSSERRRILHRYQNGEDDPVVLCNFGVLTTGFDAPRTSASVIARPTQSLVLYSQMVGRAMRGPRAQGNDECEIVTVVDRSIPGFADMADAFMHWNHVWGDPQ